MYRLYLSYAANFVSVTVWVRVVLKTYEHIYFLGGLNEEHLC